MSDKGLNETNFNMLGKALLKRPTAYTLIDLSNNPYLKDLSLKLLATILQRATNLESLNIEKIGASEASLANLLGVILSTSGIQSLSIGCNPIHKPVIQTLSKQINQSQLRSLNL